MRNRLYNILFFSVVLMVGTSVCSCEKTIEFKGDYIGEKMVLYCSPSSESDEISVRLYRSSFFLSGSYDRLEDRLTGASVSGSIDGNDIVFVEKTEMKGIYTCRYKVTPGQEVKVHAHYEGLKDVSSVTVVPERPDFDAKLVSVSGSDRREDEISIGLAVTIHDDGTRKNYYRISVCSWDDEIGGYISRFARSSDVLFMDLDPDFFEMYDSPEVSTPSVRGYITDDALFDGKDYSFSLDLDLFGIEGTGTDGDTEIRGLDLALRIDALSDDLFKHEKSKILSRTSNTTFSEPICIHSNIRNGIGCLGASSTSWVTLK